MHGTFRTHHEIIKEIASKYPDKTFFKIPDEKDEEAWKDLTYLAVDEMADNIGGYLLKDLQERNIPSGAVVTLWMTGLEWHDMVYAMGLSRAGYVAHLLSSAFQNKAVIESLLTEAKSSILYHLPSNGFPFDDISIPQAVFPQLLSIIDHPVTTSSNLPLPGISAKPEDPAYVYHTSGTTGDLPKTVIWDHWRIHTTYDKWKVADVPSAHQYKKQAIAAEIAWVHVGGLIVLIQCLRLNYSLLHFSPTRPLTLGTLKHLIQDVGVTHLMQYGTHLGETLRAAQKDGELQSALTKLDYAWYGGAECPRESLKWADENGVSILTGTGNTEAGMLLFSRLGDPPQIVKAVSDYPRQWLPIPSKHDSLQLYELCSDRSTPDFPAEDQSTKDDGIYHTGDLFEKVTEDGYMFRGRAVDWIQLASGDMVDIITLEDEIYKACSHLISACAVVGNNRPNPVLFVEPSDVYANNPTRSELSTLILTTLETVMKGRNNYESIRSTSQICVVDKGTLPRTVVKGNIRRLAIETEFKETLEQM